MKRTIQGTVYNTHAPRTKLIAVISGRLSGECWFHEGLYRSSSGKHFIAGYGGPESRYAKFDPESGQFLESERLFPVTDRGAYLWARKSELPAGALKAWFPTRGR